MFIEVYAKRYPSAYKRFNEIKNTPNKYRENPAYIDRFLKLTGLEFNFFCFLVYSSEMQEIIERLLDLHYRDEMKSHRSDEGKTLNEKNQQNGW